MYELPLSLQSIIDSDVPPTLDLGTDIPPTFQAFIGELQVFFMLQLQPADPTQFDCYHSFSYHQIRVQIARHMAHKYGGKHSKAWHSDYPTGPVPTLQSQPLSYLRALLTPSLPREKAIDPRTQYFSSQREAYYVQQSTQPQTLAYSLQDSPAGMFSLDLREIDELERWGGRRRICLGR
ncbi:hypothetical protein BT96DRAFT_1025322 [Gymnopus androsaceus JB14]|uniref:Uncharacterized protein n=1 Tax=Gymnopus androsaceus JB14 TaxID=1447944 RepID=A0A6A4GSF4_9AGAR|nr:hypothetical protein BT96DRAFT_1025322 [Gymnopus androsaceus JB14]